MTLVFDAGALIAADRGSRHVWRHVELARRNESAMITIAPVVGQGWRDGARQARLARLVSALDVHPVALSDAKQAGELLAASGMSDVVDASLALVVRSGDQVLTSDADDLRPLLASRSVTATVIPV